MLHRVAAVPPGGIIVVLAADGGIGGSLVQLGRRAGLSVIAIAPPRDQESLRQQGAVAMNCWAPDLLEQVLAYSPDGVDAVFNHVGEETLAKSWAGLRRGGTLVLYSSLSTNNDDDPRLGPSAKDAARLRLWNLLPNGRRAHSFNLHSGQFRSGRQRQQWWREDTGKVLQLLAENVLTPRIAARFPLSEADLALTLAESPDLRGKVVIVPDA